AAPTSAAARPRLPGGARATAVNAVGADVGRRGPGSPLVALSPGDLPGAEVDMRSFLARVEAAVEGGLRALVLREPLLTDRALLELARRVRALLGSTGWLCVHDRVHVARAAEADAAHLG